MANTIKFGNENWATKKDSILAYNDENANFKPLPFVTSRASTATRVNKAGLLETVASGVPRVDYLDNSKGSYLLEPASTNLITQSEAFDNSYWTKSNASIEGDASTVGVEKVVNGDFDTDTNWSKDSGWTISGGTANYDAVSSNQDLEQAITLTEGSIYAITFEIKSGEFRGRFLSLNSSIIENNNYTVGTHTVYGSVSSGSNLFVIKAVNTTGGSSFSIDNVSVKEVQGFASPSADSPLGALKLVEDSILSTKSIKTSTFTSVNGQEYTISIFAKPNGRILQITPSTAFIQRYINYDLDSGTMDLSGAGDAFGTITLLNNGYYRCTYTASANASSTVANIFYCLVDSPTATRRQTYTGNGTSGVYIFGAQVEQSSYATSYIPTSGSQITKLEDTASQEVPDGLINSSQGVLYAEISALSNEGDTYRTISLNDGSGTNTNRILIGYTNTDNIYAQINNTLIGITGTNFNVKNLNKLAVVYNGSIAKFFLNGAQVGTGITTAPTLIGLDNITSSSGAATSVFEGKVKDLNLYNTSLTDAELVTLTKV